MKNSKLVMVMCGIAAVCVITLCAWRSATAGNKAAPKYNIDNCVATLLTEKAQVTDAGWQYWFFRETFTESATNLKMSYVDKTTAMHPPHKHFDKEIFYIIEGEAEVYLEGATRVIGANSSFFCPSNMMHGIKRANTDLPLRYLVIRGGKKSDITTPQKGEFTLDNCVTEFSAEKVQTSKTGWFFWFAPKQFTEGLNLKMTYVDKLTGTHEAHQHQGDELIYLLDGQAEVFIDNVSKIVQPGTALYYPDSSLHCLKRSNLEQPVRYLVINP
jgi:quercetin dioxygenase-like cupin family protein